MVEIGIGIAGLCGLAASIAAVVNLPFSGSIRFLLLVALIWAIGVLFWLSRIHDLLSEQNIIRRLIFITLHIRNEADNLPPAPGRLKEDLRHEVDAQQFLTPLSGHASFFGLSISFAVFLLALGFLLQYGVFGNFGECWADRILHVTLRHCLP